MTQRRPGGGALANRIQILACGFLLAVLWMDLKFDLLLVPHIRVDEPATRETLDAIAAYYRRVLAAERGTFMLIVTMMASGLLASLWQAFRAGDVPRWMRIGSVILYAPPVILAVARIVPLAGRFGVQDSDIGSQRAMAAEIFYSHAYCFVSMACCATLLLAMRFRIDHRP